MTVTESTLILIILLDTITSFFVGAILGGNLVRFPFHTASYVGVESLIGRRCVVRRVSGKRIDVIANSQMWSATPLHEGEVFLRGEVALIKGIEGLKLQIEKIR